MFTSLGKYRIDGDLGRGAMGVVYKAYDTSLQRTVALKTISSKLVNSGENPLWMARFQQEAQAIGRCLHPNLVAVFDFGSEQGTHYMVMEYVAGSDLKKLLRTKGSLGAVATLRIAAQVLDGLEHAHQRGVVHRDIKPSNIVVTRHGEAKVTDFGVAHLDTSELTQDGVTMGTYSYTAPEQLLGNPVCHLSDIYSVGVLAYELLCGKKPFGPAPAVKTVDYVMTRELDFAGTEGHIAPALRGVIRRATAKNPADRFQSAGEFAELLSQLLRILTAANQDGYVGAALEAA